MSITPKATRNDYSPSRKSSASPQQSGINAAKTVSKVRKMDLSSQKTPSWLKFYQFLYYSSSVITLCLIGGTLTVYGWTVYTQELWSQEYRRLEGLQRQERELVANHESLKDYLAQQANNPATGLVTPTTANAIFLPPVPETPLKQQPSSIAQNKIETTPKAPLGY